MDMLLDNIFGFPRVPLQRTYLWDCIMPDIWGAGILGVVVAKFCQDVSFGNYNIDDIAEMNVGAFKQFFAGRMEISNPRITIVAPAPDIVSNYLHTWRKLIIDERGFYYPSNHYKKNIYVIFYDRTGVPTNMIKLIGAFPKSGTSWKMSYADENVVKYDVEFKVDRLETGLKAFDSFLPDAAGAVGAAFNKIGGLVSGVAGGISSLF